MAAFLEVIDVHKSYGPILALRGVSFQVYEGEMFGLLGPNGAGKTTTLRALAGILTPTRGQLLINGHDVVTDPVVRLQGPGGQLAAPPLPEHGPELVFLAEADPMVTAVEAVLADREQVADLAVGVDRRAGHRSRPVQGDNRRDVAELVRPHRAQQRPDRGAVGDAR